MTKRATDQGWVLSALIGLGGLDSLHPEARGLDIELGYDYNDIELVLSRVKLGLQLPKGWAETAAQIESRAAYYDGEGFALTARDLYIRASVLWAHAQYTFFGDDPRQAAFRARAQRCVDRIIALNPTRIERVRIPFEGSTLHALVHYPEPSVDPAPAVLLLPGMDMIKEDYTLPAQRHYTSRGMVAVALDGPGQGETRIDGLVVDVTNYERAVSAVIDHLETLPEVDATRVGLWGMSMGSYWGMRAAATEPRVKGAATGLGCYGDMDLLFNGAHPNFKRNYMYMTGYEDEAAFDRDIAAHMHLWDLAPTITCPVFMGFGEFDEISRLEDTLALYDLLTAPKELAVFEQEFHPLGGVAAELMRFGAEWNERALAGDFDGGRDQRRYMRRWGDPVVGTATPPWWLAEAQPDIATIEP